MVNFYDELGIGRTCTVSEINETLGELEAKWIRRETVNPDEARKVLANISDAKKVFKDEASKREYDRSLITEQNAAVSSAGSTGGNTYNNVRPVNNRTVSGNNGSQTGFDADKQDIENWIQKTIKYCDAKKYDLAAGAIEHVFERTQPSERSDELYGIAAEIYGSLGQYDRSLEYINKALAMKPTALYYNRKANICLQKMLESSRRDADKLQMQMQYALEDALKLENIKKNGKNTKRNRIDKSITYGLYAAMYWQIDSVDSAKECAEKAVKLGDKSGYGLQVQEFLRKRKNIGTYKALMPVGYILFFIVDIVTAALLFVTGGTIGTVMLIASMLATAFLNYVTCAYPYGGRSIVWGIIFSCLFGAGLSYLYGSVYGSAFSTIIVIFAFYIILTIVLCIVGRSQKKKLLA